MGKRIGIDLGTTNSIVACLDGPSPNVLNNCDGKAQTRSVVGLKKRRGKAEKGDAEEILIGDVALDNWPMAPRDTIVSIKRLMGRVNSDAEVDKVRQHYQYAVVADPSGTKDGIAVKLGDKHYTPIEISAMILAKLKADAEFRLNDKVTHAVITVPAYFTQVQKDATRKAGQKAGMIVKLLDEPTAAAIAFGVDSPENSESSDAKTILVYDLGGGTFDISVMVVSGGTFAQLTLEGDMWLGGDNFDQVLIDHALTHVKNDLEITINPDDPKHTRFLVELRKAAQSVKERLSSSNMKSADLVVSGLLTDKAGNLIDVVIEVQRQEFERMIAPLIERSVALVKTALKNSDNDPSRIDYVIMAGNSTCIPAVQKAMEDLFGKDKVSNKMHPKHCVAMGAAIHAAQLPQGIVCEAPSKGDPNTLCNHVNPMEAKVCEVCGAQLTELGGVGGGGGGGGGGGIISIAAFNYGAQSEGDRFNLFIKKGDVVPTPEDQRQPQTFATRAANQRILAIPVYGGDDLVKASNNEKQGEAIMVLPPSLPKGARVQVRIWLDSDGVFQLSAHLEDGTSLNPFTVSGDKSQKAVEVIQQMEKLLLDQSKGLNAEVRKDIEAKRTDAFNNLQRHDFKGAQDKADEIEKTVKDNSWENKSLKDKANGLISWTEGILQRYSWALSAGDEDRLNRMIKDLRAAVATSDPSMQKLYDELFTATDKLPEIVLLFNSIFGAIRVRIAPSNPGLAAELRQLAMEVEKSFKNRSPAANEQFGDLAKRVTEAVKKVESESGVAIPCRNPACNAELRGERYCPKCGDDSWAPRSDAVRSSSTAFIKKLDEL